jgi:hypothetical protein
LGEGRISGALKQKILAKGVNPDRKSLVLQDCWGLGMGLTIPPHKNQTVTKATALDKFFGDGLVNVNGHEY